jgi:tRNA G46 methylase TrmB
MELGMGDGRHLCELSRDAQNTNTLFIGIENDATLFTEAARYINANNVLLINDNFENRITDFKNETIDKVIMILPDPKYIDRHYYDDWMSLYANIFLKLKKLGELEIVTEIIDELLQPVSDVAYHTWAKWLVEAFVKIGFGVADILNGAPVNYASTCLDRFTQDPERIRLMTLRLVKPREIERNLLPRT